MKIKKNGKVVNLTESDLKRIVKRVLTEEDAKSSWNENMGDPSWLIEPAKEAATSFGNGVTMKVKPNTTYSQKYSYAAATVGLNKVSGIILIPKGTVWETSASGYFLIAKGYYTRNDNFGYGDGTAEVTGLKDGSYIKKAADGKAKGTDGKLIRREMINIAFNPGSESVIFPGQNSPDGLTLRWPNENLFKKLSSFSI